MPRATPKEIRDFFEAGGGRKVTASELAKLKSDTKPDAYDQIAEGIGNGTLTY